MPQTALENGAGALMQALLGGGRVEQNAQLRQQAAYDQADGLRADLDRKITEAHLQRDKRNAQQNMEPGYIANGVDPTMAHLLASANIGGFANLEQAQKYDMTHRAEAALAADPNITPANAVLAAMHGQPISDVRVDDGNAITHQYGAAPTIAPTQEGLAKIAADAALQRQRDAAARQHDARANGTATTVHNGDVVRDVGPNGQPIYHRKGDARDDANSAINDAVAGGADPMGYSIESVIRDLKGPHGAAFLPAPSAGQMRLITPDAVENVAQHIVPAAPPPAAPVAPAPHADGGPLDHFLSYLGLGGGGAPTPAAQHAQGAQSVVAPAAAPPPAAVAFLRANPSQAAAFEAKYGVPAAMYLR